MIRVTDMAPIGGYIERSSSELVNGPDRTSLVIF